MPELLEPEDTYCRIGEEPSQVQVDSLTVSEDHDEANAAIEEEEDGPIRVL